jgi:hypothetical protein
MSSWANRLIPRKRDLSQIPDAFRPTIVPRVERPEIVLSETFQVKAENEVIYPDKSEWKSSFQSLPSYSSNSNTLSTKRVPTIPAIELIHNEKSYVFVILRNIQKTSDNDLWLSAYQSIRQFYTNQIIIIDDNSTLNTFNGKLVNTEIIQSEYNGAGEILPYYYFLKGKWADTMIFLHDSMVLHRLFTEDELDHEVVMHWHFNEKDTVNVKKSVTLLSYLIKSKEIEEYAVNGEWVGVFGGACIIDLSVIEMLEEKYKVTNLVNFIRTRKQRQLIERVLGILLCYEKNVTSNFGDIHKYPKNFESINLQTSIHNISQANYNTAIIKLWRGR